MEWWQAVICKLVKPGHAHRAPPAPPAAREMGKVESCGGVASSQSQRRSLQGHGAVSAAEASQQLSGSMPPRPCVLFAPILRMQGGTGALPSPSPAVYVVSALSRMYRYLQTGSNQEWRTWSARCPGCACKWEATKRECTWSARRRGYTGTCKGKQFKRVVYMVYVGWCTWSVRCLEVSANGKQSRESCTWSARLECRGLCTDK